MKKMYIIGIVLALLLVTSVSAIIVKERGILNYKAVQRSGSIIIEGEYYDNRPNYTPSGEIEAYCNGMHIQTTAYRMSNSAKGKVTHVYVKVPATEDCKKGHAAYIKVDDWQSEEKIIVKKSKKKPSPVIVDPLIIEYEQCKADAKTKYDALVETKPFLAWIQYQQALKICEWKYNKAVCEDAGNTWHHGHCHTTI